VTGYEILRGLSQNTLTQIATVPGRTATSYGDTSVGGFSTTYWYEVVAVAGGSSAASAAASATTPALCL
jgi:hypothetical protein